jgi:phosphohistidine phosphatase
MYLILMRHAQAEPTDPKHHREDAERPLTHAGRKIQKKVAIALKRMEYHPHCILTSPRLRARQTAEITAQVLGLQSALKLDAVLADEYSPAALVRLLRSFGDKTTICIGHEPDLSRFAGLLLGPETGPRIRLETSGILIIHFDGAIDIGRGTLISFYRAEDLLRFL